MYPLVVTYSQIRNLYLPLSGVRRRESADDNDYRTDLYAERPQDICLYGDRGKVVITIYIVFCRGYSNGQPLHCIWGGRKMIWKTIFLVGQKIGCSDKGYIVDWVIDFRLGVFFLGGAFVLAIIGRQKK